MLTILSILSLIQRQHNNYTNQGINFMGKRKIHEVKSEIFSLNKRKIHYIQLQTVITKKTIQNKEYQKKKKKGNDILELSLGAGRRVFFVAGLRNRSIFGRGNIF